MLWKKRDEYYSEEDKLCKKKEKLFASKNYKQWGLSQEELKTIIANNYITDKVIATNCMLPKDTKQLENVFLEYGFCLNRVLEEVQRVNANDYREIRKRTKQMFDGYAAAIAELNRELVELSAHFSEDISQKPQAYKLNLIKQNLSSITMKTHTLL